ncbi:zinc finger BED domain-containing protein RICESLEEPER 2 [Tanacetum coccineum]|uniref:Zinc finger BED domain-containing protein RICESLEEPER 2 n=1 Tax=Tanacetum coccineum TaxID=301880 RepID=A0ABQ4ZB40_9ASTR
MAVCQLLRFENEELYRQSRVGLAVSLILIGLRKEFDGFVQNYNMHSLGKTVNELHAMLNLHEQTLPLLYMLFEMTLEEELSLVFSRVAKEEKNAASGAGGSGIFTIELNTFLNRSWIYNTGCGTQIYNTTQGLRASRKLKPGDLTLYVGNGQRKVVEAIGVFYLCLPSGLEIVLNNCHYAPSITRGVIYVSRLYEDGFINRFMNNTIQVSRNNMVYLDSALLWHCRLRHISKKCIEKLQHDGLLNSTDLKAFEKRVPCMSGKMARKPYTHQVERAKDLLGLNHRYITTLPKSFWDYALETAARILNMVPTKKVEKTPYEVWHGQAPKLTTRDTTSTDRLCLYIDAEEHELGDLGEPANYKAALLDPESDKWLNAMNVEMQSMKDNEVWILRKGHSVLTTDDWTKAKKLCHFLKTFYEITLRISGTKYVTTHTLVNELATIRALLRKQLDCDIHDEPPMDLHLYDIAKVMKPKFDKYYCEVENMNLLVYFAFILDPRNKYDFLHVIVDDHYGREGLSVVTKKVAYIEGEMKLFYEEYVRIHAPSSTSSSSSTLGKRQRTTNISDEPDHGDMLRSKMKNGPSSNSSSSELDKYVGETLEPFDKNVHFDILLWWKVNSLRFPILSLMARDLLAVPISTVASESVFSTSGRVLDLYRSSMGDKTIECLICTQDWLRISLNLEKSEDLDIIAEMEKELMEQEGASSKQD